MLTSNVHPSWPLGRKVALLDDAGEPLVAYAYRGMGATDYRTTGLLEGITDVPVTEVQSREETCPICGEPVVRISRNYNYGGCKTIIVVCACGSVIGYGENREVILYFMSDECMHRTEDVI